MGLKERGMGGKKGNGWGKDRVELWLEMVIGRRSCWVGGDMWFLNVGRNGGKVREKEVRWCLKGMVMLKKGIGLEIG